MELPRQQAALLVDRKLAVPRSQAPVLDGHAEMLAECLQHLPVLGRDPARRAEIQVEHAEQLALQADRKNGDDPVAGLAAVGGDVRRDFIQ